MNLISNIDKTLFSNEEMSEGEKKTAHVYHMLITWAMYLDKPHTNVIQAAKDAAAEMVGDIFVEQGVDMTKLENLEMINNITAFIAVPMEHLNEMATRQDPDDRRLARRALKVINIWESIPTPVRYVLGYVQGIPYRLTPAFFIDYIIDRQTKKFSEALGRPVEETKAKYIAAMNKIYDALEKFPNGFPLMQGFCKAAKMSKWMR